MGHYDNCREENCSKCGQLIGYCEHTKINQLDIQVDGEHYKNLKIQPAEYSYKNKLNWHQGEIIKYVTRYKNKNGRVDLEKAKHLIEMLIEFEYEN